MRVQGLVVALRGVAVQVAFESKGFLTPVSHLTVRGLEPGAFLKLWVNWIRACTGFPTTSPRLWKAYIRLVDNERGPLQQLTTTGAWVGGGSGGRETE
jgi:hypothetical protein